jgi:hypothetical protein
MQKRHVFIITLGVLSLLVFVSATPAQLKDVLRGAQNLFGQQSLSESRIIQGLKEALQIGTRNAVSAVSQPNGYFDNLDIRIPLPEHLRKAEKALRLVGYGQQLDDFELSMNRAAEKAAPEAAALFTDAIGQMSFADAKKILNGRDNEATLYFQDKTSAKLHQVFEPIVHDAMDGVGVTRSYQQIEDKAKSLPFSQSLDFDLDRYVTDKALGGLFHMLAAEESKIRTDPSARVTDLLQEVFGAAR